MNSTLVSLGALLDAYAEGDVEVHVAVAVLQGRSLLLLAGGASGQVSLPTVPLEPGERLLRAGERAGALAGLRVTCGRLLVLLESIAGARHRLTLAFAAAVDPPSDGRGVWVPVRRLAASPLDPWLAFGLRTALQPGVRAPVHVLGAELPPLQG